jgi:WD40 repeat protein
MKPRLQITAALLGIVILTACTRGQVAPPLQITASPTQVAAAKIINTQPTSTIPVMPLSSIPFKDSALVTQFDRKLNISILAPVDPLTGQQLKGYTPINAGLAGLSYSFSPDKKTLIFITYASNSSPAQPTLHFLDLSAWKDSLLSLNQFYLNGWISGWALSPDGKRFAITTTDKNDDLLLVDVIKHRVIARTNTSYQVNNLQFTADSSGLMIYGHRWDQNTGVIQGAPVAELLSAQDLSPTWSVKLNNVRDGFQPNPKFTGSVYEPGAGTVYSPGIVFSPIKDTLYIVHADVDKLTQVDFDRRSVTILDIRPKLSWFEQFLMLSAGNAYAKGQEGIELQAVISPDGSVIYTTGTQNKVDITSNGDVNFTQTPLNLKAINAADGIELFKSEATGSNPSFSSDGASLFLDQYLDSGYLSETDEVNARTGVLIARYKDLALQATHRMDGTALLVSTAQGYTNQSITKMTAFTADHTLLGKWTAPEYAEWLIMP